MKKILLFSILLFVFFIPLKKITAQGQYNYDFSGSPGTVEPGITSPDYTVGITTPDGDYFVPGEEDKAKDRKDLNPLGQLQVKIPGIDELVAKHPIICEDDGDKESYPISVENIDLGIFEDKEIQGKNIPKPPQLVDSNIDSRRIRAIVVELLQNAANDGDTLLSWEELREKLSELR